LRGEPILKASILLMMIAAFYACSALPHKPGLDQMLATAKTASDHEAIAEEYEKEAADAEAQYEKHQAGVSMYQKGTERLHCARLARDYQQAQLDAAALAAYHRTVAEEMKSRLGAAAAQTPAAALKSQ
jgi:hypothetical protein